MATECVECAIYCSSYETEQVCMWISESRRVVSVVCRLDFSGFMGKAIAKDGLCS